MNDRCNSLSNDLIISQKNLDLIRHTYEALQSDYEDIKVEKQKIEDKFAVSEKELTVQKNENNELRVNFFNFKLTITKYYIF